MIMESSMFISYVGAEVTHSRIPIGLALTVPVWPFWRTAG